MNVKYILTVVIKGTLFTNSKMKLKDRRRCHKFPCKQRIKKFNLNTLTNEINLSSYDLKDYRYI